MNAVKRLLDLIDDRLSWYVWAMLLYLGVSTFLWIEIFTKFPGRNFADDLGAFLVCALLTITYLLWLLVELVALPTLIVQEKDPDAVVWFFVKCFLVTLGLSFLLLISRFEYVFSLYSIHP